MCWSNTCFWMASKMESTVDLSLSTDKLGTICIGVDVGF